MTAYNFRQTISDVLGSLTPARDARVIRNRFGCFVMMDDDGYGEYETNVSEAEADALVAEGYCRDAR